MKKCILMPFLVLTLMTCFLSCKKDFLEVVPLGSNVATVTHDYDLLMNSNHFYDSTFPSWGPAVMMGDDVSYEESYGLFIDAVSKRLFQWSADVYLPTDLTPSDITQDMRNLYVLNKIINEVGDSKGGTEEQKKMLIAEAKATRACYYLQFINYYGKPYVAATAGSDPGYPIIKEAIVDPKAVYERNSVQEVYDFIIKDLTEAIPDLPLKPIIQTRMSKPAAEGLLARAYLYMGRYSDVAAASKEALDDVTAAGVTRLYDYNVEFDSGGAFLPIDPVGGPAGPGMNKNDFTEAIVSKVFSNAKGGGLTITPKVQALFAPSDLRLKLYNRNGFDNQPIPGGRICRYAYYSRFGVQLPDVILMNAEARARTGDLSGAVTAIETLRKSRMPVADASVPDDIVDNQNALINFILDERQREFAGEGIRWFDMRRLSVDPLFPDLKFTHTSYSITNVPTVIQMDQPNRLTLRIPPSVLTANPNWTNNP